ncbi:Outer membrane protein assembly factor BamA [uncultured Alphaproteobacteria bacterium]|uniref:Outer membrane protein assembly factor BamA n=1 Tax=uncultured Alphaproteobacteria bacterium TaxID=91750 RepID=A0A212J880_9PROT|nr:Outer membrane protein assembly factor BamA [uncultured Alphaproteobacteria bacterium]
MRAKGFGRHVRWGMIAATLWALPYGTAQAQSLENIRVEGTQRIEDATIRSYMALQEGDRIDAERVNKSLKSLFATGLFADVRIRRDGNDLIVSVVENPVINRVVFEGNKRIKDEDLQGEVRMRPRSVYTRARVLADVERIQEIYRRAGRYGASVEPKVIQQDQNRVDLVFEINEGPITYVQKISFNGNTHFSDDRLRDEILTKETAWYRFLSSSDTYDPQRMAFDREKLRRFYLSKGYADFAIQSAVAELSPDREGFFLTFTVDEGKRYEIGSIAIETTLPEFDDPEVLRKELTFAEGDWYNADEVENSVQALTDAVGALGYAFVDIKPDIVRNTEAGTLDLTFRVDPGPRAYVDRIEINGNLRTLDEVIRREFRLVEGDPFNSAKVRRTRQRLQNLGFFKSVDIQTEPSQTDPDKVTLKVSVEEQSTGQVTLGAGYSSTDGAKIMFGIGESNLLGTGQNLQFNVALAQSGTEADISYTEPYFLNRDVAAGFDLFRITRDWQDESSYDYKSTGFALRAGYSYSENLRHTWRYTLRQDEIQDVDDDASLFIKEQEGTTVLSQIGHRLTYDRRDNKMDPSEGYVVGVGNDVAGAGGDARFVRTNLNAGQYFTLADGYVLGFTGQVGYMFDLGKDIAISHRYFLGGENSMRGFAQAGISPRDKETGDALGSNWSTNESVELRFPLGTPEELGLSAKAFVDLGTSGKFDGMDRSEVDYSSAFRVSAGFGFIWRSPMGPMNLNFGFPLAKESFDETEAIQFNFGTRF